MYGRDAGGHGVSLLINHDYLSPNIVPTEPAKKQPGVFSFLKLPAEIRNMIYSYVMKPRNPVYVYVRRFQSGVNTGLLYANRQVYQEASTVLYANIRGIVCNECHFLTRGLYREDILDMSVCADPEHPFLPSPPWSLHMFHEGHCTELQACRRPPLKYISPRMLARMAEIEISLAWLKLKFHLHGCHGTMTIGNRAPRLSCVTQPDGCIAFATSWGKRAIRKTRVSS